MRAAGTPPEGPPPSVGQRLGSHLGLKLGVWLGLAVGICVPYFGLQRLLAQPARTLPETPLDAAVAFDPAWTGVYASVALLVALAPLLATRRDELLRYARGLALLCAVCFGLFWLFPVAGPRPPDPPDAGLYGAIVSLDRPTNSLPSLHAGLAVYSLLFGARVLRGALGPRGRALYLAVALVWGGGILYATLATKQHWALDLPAGALAAWAAHAAVWRR